MDNQFQDAGPQEQAADERARAVEMLVPVFTSHASPIPISAELLGMLADRCEDSARSMLERSLVTEDPDLVTATVRLWQRIVDATPADHPGHADRLTNLSCALRTRFSRTRMPVDRDGAVETAQRAVTLSAAADFGFAIRLNNLNIALLSRFGHTGALPDLDGAIEIARQAVAAYSDDYGLLTGLNNLGIALQTRFGRTGVLADLDEAVDVARRAVAATPADDPDLVARLSNLGVALQTRFGCTGVLADLDEAVDVARRAVAATPAAHPDLVGSLTNLGLALRRRFERTGVSADADEAIDVAHRAIAATPAGHPCIATLHNNLAIALGARFERSGVTPDLDDAVESARRAVAETPAHHPDLAARLHNLGVALRTLFARTSAPADLDDAVEAARRAVAETPVDHPRLAIRYVGLGLALRTRFTHADAADDRDAAVESFRSALNTAAALPLQRIQAARAAAGLLVVGKPGEAAGLLDRAVRLLPEVAPRYLDRSDRQYALGQFAGLATNAAALALSDPQTPPGRRAGAAIRLLELGRAVIMNQALSLRGESGRLAEAHPELAAEFARLRDLLDSDPTAHPERSARTGADRRQLGDELEDVLARIRARSGFESFALPPALDELVAEAVEGPIVVFNISRYRSDALLVTPTGVTSLPLPGLAYDTTSRRAATFLDAIDTIHRATDLPTLRAAQRHLRDTLEWLWDNATEPTLIALGYHGPSPEGESLPRVWWIPSGPLAQLPIHAAGYHADRTRTVLDRVVSTYAPTIAALRHARRRTRESTRPQDIRPLVVAMRTTQGNQSRLTRARTEVATIATRMPGAIVLAEPDAAAPPVAADLLPTKANIIARLPQSPIAHFLCHGISDPADPARSRLLLHDHDFTVADLDPIRLDHAQLAYLSACETAVTTTPELLDEAIHLASAFQLAGYPHVIGTLWSVNDQAAATIADLFYTELPATPYPDTSHVAHALHRAIIEMRDRHPGMPSLWAAHLHTGA